MQNISATTSFQLSLLLLLLCAILNAHAQFFYHQAFAEQQQQPHYAAFHADEHISPYEPLHGAAPHPSVVRNAQWESELPPELSKSARFYNNPHIAAGLAQQSLLTNKEMAVVEREAEKIPREQVYKLFKNAGYLRRR